MLGFELRVLFLDIDLARVLPPWPEVRADIDVTLRGFASRCSGAEEDRKGNPVFRLEEIL